MRPRISWATFSWPTMSWATIAALLLAAVSVAVTLSLIDYPRGVAWDEVVKLIGVTKGRYAYYHPLFMIDLAQGAALVVQPPDMASLAHLVQGAWRFGRRRHGVRDLQPGTAGAARPAGLGGGGGQRRGAARRCACPSVQGGYFRRGFIVLALAALIRLLQEPAPHRAILLGLLVGLAAGSKYIGVLILPFAVIAILLVPTPGPERRWLRAGTVTATSIGTFLLIMLPAIRRIARWERGVNFELVHSVEGHDVPLPLRVTWGLFHLRESLWPGLGTPLFALGLIGLAAPLVAARERRMPLLLIAGFTLLWYAVHEATPLKPFPDFSRYMLPLVPLFAILGTSFVYELSSRFDRRGVIAAIAVLLAAVPALSTSLRINSHDVDPRTVVPSIVEASGVRVVLRSLFRLPAERPQNPWATSCAQPRTRPISWSRRIWLTIASSSMQARKGSVQADSAAYYRQLFTRPYLEVSNGRPTLAYFNPVVRIVAMDGSVERLEKIAADIHAAAPGLTVRLIDQAPPSNE